ISNTLLAPARARFSAAPELREAGPAALAFGIPILRATVLTPPHAPPAAGPNPDSASRQSVRPATRASPDLPRMAAKDPACVWRGQFPRRMPNRTDDSR